MAKKKTFKELPRIEQNPTLRLVEAIGLYRGHLWSVTFYPTDGHRCAYISYDKEHDHNPEEVLLNEITYYGKADHIIEGGVLGCPIVGWDYMHIWDCRDFKSARKYVYTADLSAEDRKKILDLQYFHRENQKILKPKVRHSLSSVIKDCKAEIDRLIDGPTEDDTEETD